MNREITIDELFALPIVPVYRIGIYDDEKKCYRYDDRYSVFIFEYVHRALERIVFDHAGCELKYRQKYVEFLSGSLDVCEWVDGPRETMGNKIAVECVCSYLDWLGGPPALTFEKRTTFVFEKMSDDEVRKILRESVLAFDREITIEKNE